MIQYVLVKARKSRGGPSSVAHDYDVRVSRGKVVGRIMRHPKAPKRSAVVSDVRLSVSSMRVAVHRKGRRHPRIFLGCIYDFIEQRIEIPSAGYRQGKEEGFYKVKWP